LDQSFGEWYGAASVEVTDETLRKRWAGVEQAAKDLGEHLDLVRCFFDRKIQDPDFISKFRTIFFGLDATFRPSGNDTEIRTLCGSILAYQFSKPASASITSLALAVICVSNAGAVKVLVPAVVTKARSLILAQALNFRAETVTKSVPLETLLTTLVAKITQTAETGDLKAVAKDISDGLGEVSKLIREELSDLTVTAAGLPQARRS
jgi:hypothetical protein